MRRLIKIGAPVLAIAALAATAWAYWSTHATGTASASVATLNAPTDLSVPSNSSGAVHITWTGSTVSNGTPATGYYVTRVKNSDSSTTNACGTSPSAPTTATSCDDTISTDGTYHYTVTAIFHSWTATSGSSGNVTVVTDVSAPTASILSPEDGGSYNSSGWSLGCSPAGICGSASDSSGVQSVKVSVKRSSDGAYWNGSAFSGTSESFNTATLAAPGSPSTSWTYALPLPGEGSYVIHVQTADTIGNAQSGTTYAATSTFVVDTTAPSVALTKVNGSSQAFPFRTNGSVTSIGGTCGSGPTDNSVSWSIGSRFGTATCSAGSWTSGSFMAITAEGTYSAQVNQSDTAGNLGSDTKSVIIDKTAPSVAVTTVNGSPQSFPFRTNGSVTSIGGTCGSGATDNGTVSWSIGPRSGSASCSAGSWASGSFAAITAEGTYSAQVSQGDTAGNTGSDTQSVIIDKTGPSVAVTTVNGSPQSFPVRTNASVTSIGGTCASGAGDNGTVSWSIGPRSGSAACSSGSWTSGNFTAITAEGTYSAQVSQGDTAGNTGSDSQSVVIDTTNPATTISISPTLPNGSNGWYKTTTPTFTLSATDAGTGIASTSYQIDGGTTQSYSSAVTIPDGQHTITYWSVDRAGNSETQHTTATIKVDTVAPTLDLVTTAPTTGTYHGGIFATTLFFNNCVNAAYRLNATVGDATSGAASAAFPLLTATGWTQHNAETITTPSGGPYTSTDFKWTANNCTGGKAGTPADYTVTASDAAGNQSTETLSFSPDSTAPTVTNVTLNNGGTSGTIDQNDFVELTYSEIMNATSFCSTWSNGSTQTLTSGVTASVTGSDNLTVSACGGSFSFGTVALVGNYNTGTTMSFSTGTSLTWDPSTKKLKLVLGAHTGGTAATGVGNAVPTYTRNGSTSLQESDLAQNALAIGAASGTSSHF